MCGLTLMRKKCTLSYNSTAVQRHEGVHLSRDLWTEFSRSPFTTDTQLQTTTVEIVKPSVFSLKSIRNMKLCQVKTEQFTKSGPAQYWVLLVQFHCDHSGFALYLTLMSVGVRWKANTSGCAVHTSLRALNIHIYPCHFCPCLLCVCVCVCVWTEWISSAHYFGISTYLEARYVLRQCITFVVKLAGL